MKSLEFKIISSRYLAGKTNDGDDYVAEAYMVFIEGADGSRWSHDKSFPGCRVVYSEAGEVQFDDTRKDALHAANQLISELRQQKQIDLNGWRKETPRFGSEAYERLNPTLRIRYKN